jgi:murein DD-endopeptidase MepM/ murein hydrolase activator NlpD
VLWYISAVPPSRPRSLRSRVLLPAVLGIVAFAAFGARTTAPGILTGVSALERDQAVAGAVEMAPQRAPAPFAALPDAAQAAPGDAPPLETLTGYRWPIAHPRLTLPFGPTPWGTRVVSGQLFHDGIDLATFCGDRIMAAHDGVVLAASRHFDDEMGWVGDLRPYYRRLDVKKLWSTLPIVVVIDDGNGYRSVYAHFSKVTVKVGDRVRAGQRIGYEGMTGRASGCHLHYDLFSPFEADRFAMDPGVARRMKLPTSEIARVDPTLVLPPFPTNGGPARVPPVGLDLSPAER